MLEYKFRKVHNACSQNQADFSQSALSTAEVARAELEDEIMITVVSKRKRRQHNDVYSGWSDKKSETSAQQSSAINVKLPTLSEFSIAQLMDTIYEQWCELVEMLGSAFNSEKN